MCMNMNKNTFCMVCCIFFALTWRWEGWISLLLLFLPSLVDVVYTYCIFIVYTQCCSLHIFMNYPCRLMSGPGVTASFGRQQSTETLDCWVIHKCYPQSLKRRFSLFGYSSIRRCNIKRKNIENRYEDPGSEGWDRGNVAE